MSKIVASVHSNFYLKVIFFSGGGGGGRDAQFSPNFVTRARFLSMIFVPEAGLFNGTFTEARA